MILQSRVVTEEELVARSLDAQADFIRFVLELQRRHPDVEERALAQKIKD